MNASVNRKQRRPLGSMETVLREQKHNGINKNEWSV